MQKYLSTGTKIKPEHWNNNEKKVNRKNPEHYIMNNFLQKAQQKLIDYEMKLRQSNIDYDIKTLVAFYKGDNDKLNDDFILFAKKRLQENKSITSGTYRMHKSILTHLTEFRETIKFSQLNYDLIVEFDNWLRLRKYHQNTIRNHHKTVKAYINKAIKSGIIPRDQYPYENFKLKEIKSTRKGITNKELARIEELKLSFNEMKVVKDMFLFSCYAGLRFSDMRNLKKENVNIAADGQLTIAFTMQKTSTHIKLPLSYLFNGKPAEIIRKYYKETDNT